MKLIPLTQGLFAQVDDADFDWLNKWKWYALKTKTSTTHYARRTFKLKGRSFSVFMHRLILDIDDSDILGDHIDGNGLNNQRHNLRKATHSQNSKNRKSGLNSSSRFLGVSIKNNRHCVKLASGEVKVYAYQYWRATIIVLGKAIELGNFKVEEEAAHAYNVAAKKYHGDFANLNIIV